MKSLNILSIVLVSLFALSNVGCGKGPKGDPGAPGAPGPVGPYGVNNGGKVVQTINCYTQISGVDPVLDGLWVEYDIVVTASDDVYASAAIIDIPNLGTQTTGSKIFAGDDINSLHPSVIINADYDAPYDNGGSWEVSYDRLTKTGNIDYFDAFFTPSIPIPVVDCTTKNW